ncbi:MAG: hypothetical protein RL757_24 [Bacteroidota bacterium]|jgi:cell wall assembly regulator SMI1
MLGCRVLRLRSLVCENAPPQYIPLKSEKKGNNLEICLKKGLISIEF